jgi:hypothetical protein
MLLSLAHKFIFVANVKTASTSIEATLLNFAEIRVRKTEFGKHNGLSAISQDYPWVRRYVPYNEFFVFGVMRDPVDHLLSLYNSHTQNKWTGTALSTREMTFDMFIDAWCSKSWQAEPQHRRFQDKHGRFQMSHVIDYNRITSDFIGICAHLGLGDLRLKHLNLSPETLTRDNLTAAQIARVERDYAQDYEFLRNRPRAF